MTHNFAETVVYYQITLAVHVDLATERVRRVVEYARRFIRAKGIQQ